MAEFPRFELMEIARTIRASASPPMDATDADTIELGIRRFDELSDRCVMDALTASLEIANLRDRLRRVDPQFPDQ